MWAVVKVKIFNKHINENFKECMEMEFNQIIELADDFIQTRDGSKFHNKKVYSDDRIIIYQVNDLWFEVFKRRVVQKMSYCDGKYCPLEGVGRVVYPGDNAFGSWAWWCHDKSVVKDVLNDLDYIADDIYRILSTFKDNKFSK